MGPSGCLVPVGAVGVDDMPIRRMKRRDGFREILEPCFEDSPGIRQSSFYLDCAGEMYAQLVVDC